MQYKTHSLISSKKITVITAFFKTVILMSLLSFILNACTQYSDTNSTKQFIPNNLIISSGTRTNDLSWRGINSAEYYTVYWSTEPNVSRENGKAIKTDIPNFKHFGLVNDITYYYRVTATINASESIESDEVSGSPEYAPPSKPSALRILAEDSRNTIIWDKIDGVTQYHLAWSDQENLSGNIQIAPDISSPFVHSGLINGATYFYQLIAENQSSQQSRSSITSAIPTRNKPVSPRFNLLEWNTNKIKLSWNNTSNAQQYKIYWNINEPFSGQVTQSDRVILTDKTEIEFTPDNIDAEYFFRIIAINEAGSSELSAEASIINSQEAKLPESRNILATPENVIIRSENSQLTLNWNPVVDAIGYNIYWRIENNDEDQPELIVTNISQAQFTQDGLLNNTIYSFRISAINNDSESKFSTKIIAIPAIIIPGVPSGLQAVSGDEWVTLRWILVQDATSYTLYVDDEAIPNAQSPFRLSNLINKQTYQLTVQSINSAGASEKSDVISIAPKNPPPHPPLQIQVSPGNAKNTLSWQKALPRNEDDVDEAVTHYKVYFGSHRNLSTQNGVLLETIAVDAIDDTAENSEKSLKFTHTALKNGKRYYYIITAVNEGGESSVSQVVWADPQVTRPGAPDNLFALAGNASITLSWNADADTRYNLYWGELLGPNKRSETEVVVNVNPGFELSNGVIKNNLNYYFRVSAIDALNESRLSAEVFATPHIIAPKSAPLQPTIINADGNVTISWDAVDESTFYSIYWSNDPDVSKELSKQNVVTGSTIKLDELINGQTYFIRISAGNESGESTLSDIIIAKPQVPTPTVPVNFQVENEGSNIILDWDTVSDISYQVYWSTDKTKSIDEWNRIPGIVNGFQHNNLSPDQTYYYQLSAITLGGESETTKILEIVAAKSIIVEPPAPVNQSPTAIAISNLQIAENAANNSLVGTLSTTDDNGDTHTYELVDDADGRFIINQAELLVLDTNLLDYDANQIHLVIIRTIDQDGLTFQKPFNINISNVNVAPVISNIGDRSNDEAETITPLTIAITDNDNDALLITVDGLPPGLSFDSQTRQISGTVNLNASQPIDYVVTINVNDQQGLDNSNVSLSFDWFIGSIATSPAKSLTAISPNQNVIAGTPVTIVVTAISNNGNVHVLGDDTVTITISGSNQNLVLPDFISQDDGRYALNYTPVNSGVDLLNIMINGEAINGSPFSLTIISGNADLNRTLFTVPDEDLIAGTSTFITASFFDSTDNPVSSPSEDVAIQVSGANSGSFPMILVDDRYEVSIRSNIAGENTYQLTLNNSPIAGFIQNQTVVAAAVNLSKTQLTTPSSDLIAGETSLLQISFFDAFDNAMRNPGGIVKINVSKPNAANYSMTLNGNVFETSISSNKAGTNTYQILIDDVIIPDISQTQTVIAANVSLSDSELSMPEGDYIAGQSNQIQTTFYDQFSNIVLSPGIIEIQVTSDTGNNDKIIPMTLAGNNFEGSVTSKIIDNNTYEILVDRNLIANIFENRSIIAASVDITKTTLSQPSGDLTAGQSVTLTASFYDAFANPVRNPGSAITIKVSGDNPGTYPMSRQGNIFQVNIPSNTAGTNTYQLEVDTVPVAGATATQTVIETNIDFSRTEFSAPTADLVAGNTANISVSFFDAVGNAITDPGGKVEIRIADVNTGIFEMTLSGNTFSVTIESTKIGVNKYQLFVAGNAVSGISDTQTVIADILKSTNTQLSANPSGNIIAGQTVTLTASFFDQFNNIVVPQGDTINLEMIGNNATVKSPMTRSGTRFTTDVTNTIAGDYSYKVLLNDTPINETELPQLVIAAGIDLGKASLTLPAGNLIAGKSVTLTAEFYDEYLNIITSPGIVEIQISGSNSGKATLLPSGNVFKATISSTIVGLNTYKILRNNVEISNLSQTQTVIAAGIVDASTKLTVPADDIIAGQPAFFSIEFFDQYGNVVTSPGGTVEIQVSGANNDNTTMTLSGNVFQGSITSNKAGFNTYKILNNNILVSGISKTRTIIAASYAEANSVFSVPTGSLTAGQTNQLSVAFFDEFDNVVTLSGETIFVQVTGNDPDKTINLNKPNNNDNYTGSTISNLAGTYNYQVFINDIPVNTFKQSRVVVAAGYATAKTIFSIPTGNNNTFIAGKTELFTIAFRDNFGNPVVNPGTDVVVQLTGNNIIDHPTALTGNVFEVSFSSDIAGDTTYKFLLDNSVIGNFSASRTILADVEDLSKTTFDIPAGNIIAGQPVTMTAAFFDRFKNPVTFAINDVVIRVSDSNSGDFIMSRTGNTYEQSITSTSAGNNDYQILLKNNPVANTSRSRTIVAAAVVLDSTILTIPVGNIVAGQAVKFTVAFVDSFGNTVTEPSGPVTIEVTGANSQTINLFLVGNKFEALNDSNTAGSNTYKVLVNDAAINIPNQKRSIIAASIDLSKTTLTIPAGNIIAGTPVEFIVAFFDSFNNPIASPGTPVEIQITGNNTAKLPMILSGNVFKRTITSNNAGSDNYTVMLSGAEISSVSDSRNVIPNILVDGKTELTIPTGNLISGQSQIVTVEFFDSFGNTITTPGGPVVFRVSGDNSGDFPLTLATNKFEGSITSSSAGTNIYNILINGQIVGSTSTTQTVVAAGASLPDTVLTIPTGNLIAGQSAKIIASFVDSKGNPVTSPGGVVAIKVTGANTGTFNMSSAENAFEVSIRSDITGANTYQLLLNNNPVTDISGIQTVVPAAINYANTSLTYTPATLDITIGNSLTIDIVMRDQFDNQVSDAVIITPSIIGANGSLILDAVTNNNDGTYQWQYQPKKTGSDTVIIDIDNKAYTKSKAINILSGIAIVNNTTAEIPIGPYNLGAIIPLKAQLFDLFNNITEGTVIFHIAGANAANITATYNSGSEKYEANYTASLSGTDTITISVNAVVATNINEARMITSNLPPIANAGDDLVVLIGNNLQLDARQSSDPEGTQISAIWTLRSKPNGSNATLDDINALRPIFTADLAGTYLIELTVSDGVNSSLIDSVKVTAKLPHQLRATDTKSMFIEPPLVVSNNKNDMLMIWRLRNPIDQVYYSFKPAGGNWSAEQYLDSLPGIPKLVSVNEQFLLIRENPSQINVEIFDGISWSSSTRPSPQIIGTSSVTCASNSCMIVSRTNTTLTADVYEFDSTSGNYVWNTFTPSSKIDFNSVNYKKPKFVASDKGYSIVWIEETGNGVQNIKSRQYIKADSTLGTWTPIIDIATSVPMLPTQSIKLVSSDQTYATSWAEKVIGAAGLYSTFASVYAEKIINSGNFNWQAPVLLLNAESTTNFYDWYIASDGSGFATTWIEPGLTANTNNLFYKIFNFNASNSSWGQSARINSNNINVTSLYQLKGNPAIGYALIWKEQSKLNPNLAFAKSSVYLSGTSFWTSAANISSALSTLSNFQLFNNNNGFIALWIDTSTSSNELFSNIFEFTAFNESWRWGTDTLHSTGFVVQNSVKIITDPNNDYFVSWKEITPKSANASNVNLDIYSHTNSNWLNTLLRLNDGNNPVIDNAGFFQYPNGNIGAYWTQDTAPQRQVMVSIIDTYAPGIPTPIIAKTYEGLIAKIKYHKNNVGDVIAVWQQFNQKFDNPGSMNDLYASVYSKGTWNTPILVQQNIDWEFKLSSIDDEFVIVYQRSLPIIPFPTSDDSLLVAKTFNTTKGLSLEKVLSTNRVLTSGYENAWVLETRDNVHIVIWHDVKNRVNANIYQYNRGSGTGSWISESALSSTNANGIEMISAAIAKNNIAVSWTNTTNQIDSAMVNIFDGTKWATEKTISSGIDNVANDFSIGTPKLATIGDGYMLVWSQKNAKDGYDTYAAQYILDAAWTSPLFVGVGSTNGRPLPNVLTNESEYLINWEGLTGVELSLRSYDSTNQKWQRNDLLIPGNAFGCRENLSFMNDFYIVCYEELYRLNFNFTTQTYKWLLPDNPLLENQTVAFEYLFSNNQISFHQITDSFSNSLVDRFSLNRNNLWEAARNFDYLNRPADHIILGDDIGFIWKDKVLTNDNSPLNAFWILPDMNP